MPTASAVQLNTGGVKALAIHGGKTQAQRDRALAAFVDGRARALVATDVAARGIHVEDLPCVVHFDPPADHTDYLHRSGRTGRAGKTGTVVSLVADEQRPANRVLQRSLGFESVIHPREKARSLGREPHAANRQPGNVSERERRVETAVQERRRAPRARTRLDTPVIHPVSRPPRPRRAGPRDPRRRGVGSPVGTVRFFDAKKGYGFLSRPNGAGDVFVHVSSIQGLVPPVLRPGQQVRFETATGRKGEEACNVTVI